MAPVSAVIIRDAWQLGERGEGESDDLIVSVDGETIFLRPYHDPQDEHIVLDRAEWEAIVRMVTDEYKRIDSLPRSEKED